MSESTKIGLQGGGTAWNPCFIGEKVVVGKNSNIGALCHVGANVSIGQGVRIQGGAYIADGCSIGDGAFIGPNATLLNDRYPPSRGNWSPVHISEEAVIGGGATVVAGVKIGKRAVLAAGGVASTDIPSGEVWVGVPAKFLMSRAEYDSRRENNE